MQPKVLNVLVGIVQHRVEMAAQVGEGIIDGSQLPLQHAPHLTGGIGSGVGGVRFDQIDDGLRLGQIQLPVQKGPLGEFPPLGRSGSCVVQCIQPCRQHGRGAVAVEFHGILPGVAVGCPAAHGHALIDDPSLAVMEGAHHQLPAGHLGKGRTLGSKNLLGDGNAPVPGHSDNANGADLTACGNGGNDTGHVVTSN